MRIARLYLRVSTEEQDLSRQAAIELSARQAGYYIAGVYSEKASGARVWRCRGWLI
jgi:DNA invertase Pin-like site-specific DNA recombinase